MKYNIKNKKRLAIMLIIILLILIVIIMSIAYATVGSIAKIEAETLVTNIIDGKIFDANMQFDMNVKNKNLYSLTKEQDSDTMMKLGYVEYIKNKEYILQYYNKIKIEKVRILKVNNNNAKISIKITKPSYKEIIDNILKNSEDENYDFENQFLAEVGSKYLKYIEKEYSIDLVKYGDKWNIVYNDALSNILYE